MLLTALIHDTSTSFHRPCSLCVQALCRCTLIAAF